jgi:hypothetical protein
VVARERDAPLQLELDADELASGTHSSGTEPYDDEGGADGDDRRRVDDDENEVGARGDDDGRRRRPTRADADEDGMPSSSNGVDAFVDPIFGTRSAPAASPPSLRGPRRRRSEQTADGRRGEGEQVADEEARGSERSVDSVGWLW